MTHSKPIDPQRVLVLGSGPGLGVAVARRFGREGFAVTLVARRPESLAKLAGQLRAEGVGSVDTFTADAADPRGFRTSLEELAARISPGVVVYNAAIMAQDNVLTSDTDYLLSTYSVDVLGGIIAAQVFTPAMREARTGTFLATGGYAGVEPYPAYATVSLGKAGLRAAVTLMHDELKADNVHAATVTIAGTIAPGTPLDPDTIADTYWALHTQPTDQWTAETTLHGR